MRQLRIWLALLIIVGGMVSATSALAAESAPNEDQPKLSSEQKGQLNTIRQEILKKQIELVDKYVEFGILTKEKGDALISDLQKREEKWQKEQMKKEESTPKKENTKKPSPKEKGR